MDLRGVFCDLVNRYAQAYMAVLAQSVACNGLHSVDERLARWLLTSHDRIGDDFPLTQRFWRSCSEFVALWVTLDFGSLSRAGLIDHAGKKICIKNRQWLEAASCECDGTVARYFAGLLS